MARPKSAAFISEMASQSEWGLEAKCQDYNPGMWDTEYHSGATLVTDDNARAIEICLSCPVMMNCLGHAVKNKITWGIWGGTVPEDRDEWAVANGYEPFRRVLGRADMQGKVA